MEDWPAETPPPPPPDLPEPPEPPAPPPLPWDDPGRPWFRAFFETVALIYQQPRQAFGRMAVTGHPLRPLLFTILIQWPLVILAGLYAIATQGSLTDELPAGHPLMAMEQMYFWLLPVFIALLPLFILVGVFISAAICHLSLMLLDDANRGFQATLRTLCYAHAGSLLYVVPCFGGVLGSVASIVFQIIGLSEVHGISKVRAALAIFLPIVFCCACMGSAMLLAYVARGPH